jgi:prepilin-type N-terminal cleavage/methylation domain-containing protein
MSYAVSDRGFTLIELIVFVVIAAIFVPASYIAFSAVMRDVTKPETLVHARFLAEQKMEELTGKPYLPETVNNPSWPNYDDVGGYLGYQWKWNTVTVAYTEDRSGTPYVTTLGVSPRVPGNHYRIGDYAKIEGAHFRVVPFPQWQPDTSYKVGDYVRSGNYPVNRHFFRCITAGRSSQTTEPSWNTSPPGVTTGEVEPSPVQWAEDTNMQSGSGSLTLPLPVPQGYELADESLRWRESTVYKTIRVYVTDPSCTSGDACAYTVDTMITGRPLGGFQ